MGPHHTQLTIRLTEPCVFLTGGTEHERARARRRRTARAAASTPSASRPGSRPSSRAPSPGPGVSAIAEDGAFVAPGPSRSGASRDRSGASRNMSPIPGGSRSASRTRVTEGTTTGGGTREEAEAADEPPPAMLRGLLTLTLAKPSRIRDISIRLRGIAKTDWPEGIGPRRLDVMEETTLVSSSWTFFSAANLSNERRAASIGPGVREHGQDLDSRGRTSARRSASMMMPSRETSAGLAYSSRDSAIHEEDVPPFAMPPHPPSALSRIASSTNLEFLDSDDPSMPTIEPWESSPAYEAVPSLPSSPITRPSDPDALDLASLTPILNRRSTSLAQQTNRRSTTPSPLGPDYHRPAVQSQLYFSSRPSSPSPSIERPAFHHTSSTDSAGFSTTSAETSDDPGTGWNPAVAPDSTRSSFERGRPATRENGIRGESWSVGMEMGNSGRGDAASRGTEVGGPTSLPQRTDSPNSSFGIPLERTTSSVSTTSTATNGVRSAMRAPSVAATGRSASSRPSARFSLAGLSDALRGKSVSRARESSVASEERGRARAESPDTRGGGRDQSRGRKTALKVLREALTSGAEEAAGETDEEDENEGKGKARAKGWKEFRAGTYTYPIAIPIPASLPPTITSDFGNVAYTLKATVHRAGALTPNLGATSEITLVSCPGQDDTEESESIVVERFWETQMKYHIALSGKSFPIGGTIPICIRLHPLAKIKLYRVTVILEQKTNYFASGRRLTRHETPKKYPLLRIEHKDPKEPLLPILSESTDAIRNHPLASFFINPTSSDDTTPSLLDPIGPWQLESTLTLPDCGSHLNFSTNHDRANISTSHILKIMLRVERGDDDFLDSKGKRKLWDVIIETPIHILSCQCTQNTLPAYSFAAPGPSSAGLSSSTTLSPLPNGLSPCAFDHSSNAPRSTSHPSTSRARSPISNPVATIEQNLLFARLVAGEETPAGEVPPTYDAVITGAVAERRMSNSSSRTARGRERRSGSVASGGSGESGREGSVGSATRERGRGGRSASVAGAGRSSSLFGRG